MFETQTTSPLAPGTPGERVRVRGNMKRACILFIVAIITAITGCQRSVPRPDGMPPLTPCTISVTFGGETIENVGVLLRAKNPKHSWGAGGRTDANGKAVLKTAGAFEGVVPGEYTISFSRRVTNTSGPMAGEISLIPMKYAPGQSQETIIVTENKSVYTFELDGGSEQ